MIVIHLKELLKISESFTNHVLNFFNQVNQIKWTIHPNQYAACYKK